MSIKSYFSSDISKFLCLPIGNIMTELVNSNPFALNDLQRDSWTKEITILKKQLINNDQSRILLEYIIPRMGKRVDCVIIHKGIVFLLEFKVGEHSVTKSALDQVLDYALDLKYFQKESQSRIIVPVVVATEVLNQDYSILFYQDRVAHPIGISGDQIGDLISTFAGLYHESQIDGKEWENSDYYPTPTIIEAAQALYNNHNVREITRNDAADLSVTTNAIKDIINHSKKQNRKSIVFVTGVPGAGKTLVGLNLSTELHNNPDDVHAVLLSGNHPLVNVLQEALVRDKLSREAVRGIKLRKADAKREVISFIQMVYHYRDFYFGNDTIPREKIAVFDESQRAWTHDEMVSFMKRNNKVKQNDLFKRDLSYSEPGFLISTMDRHHDWAVIVCLVGGGQEINRGEAGLPEWFDSIKKRFIHWDVYCTDYLKDKEYIRNRKWNELICGLSVSIRNKLHLFASIRSFRSEEVSDFVKALLDNDRERATELLRVTKSKYPICMTRSLKKAKQWVKNNARGNERYGLLASSSSSRLRAEGVIYSKDRKSISPENWFLNGKDDIRSSYYLEAVASEFETQGLELDYAIVSWDADLRIENDRWQHYNISTRLSPPNWSKIRNEEKRIFLTNSYRVLLTRARQGFIIFLPEGDDTDITRLPKYYDKTFSYFKSIGIQEI